MCTCMCGALVLWAGMKHQVFEFYWHSHTIIKMYYHLYAIDQLNILIFSWLLYFVFTLFESIIKKCEVSMSSKPAVPHRWAWQEAVWEEPWQWAPPRYTVVPTVPTSLPSPLTCGTTYVHTREKSHSHVHIVPIKQQPKAISLNTCGSTRATNRSLVLTVPIIVLKSFTLIITCSHIIGINQTNKENLVPNVYKHILLSSFFWILLFHYICYFLWWIIELDPIAIVNIGCSYWYFEIFCTKYYINTINSIKILLHFSKQSGGKL